jgi:hypothetical protein
MGFLLRLVADAVVIIFGQFGQFGHFGHFH